MSANTVIEYDCSTGESVERPMTEEEINSMQQHMAQISAAKAEEAIALAQKEAAKASAISKLEALGLSSEEIAALTN